MTRYFPIVTAERVYIAESGIQVEERRPLPRPVVSRERPERVRVWRKEPA